MFTLQVGFMSPTLIGIVPSIEMVIFCAVGGRHSILGAVYGALLVNWAKTTFSESFPELWLLGLGGALHRGGAGVPERAGRGSTTTGSRSRSSACSPRNAGNAPRQPPKPRLANGDPRRAAGPMPPRPSEESR